jgi:hypothetical protein
MARMPDDSVSHLLPEVRRLAERLGARGEFPLSAVALTQRGTMARSPRSRAMSFTARQSISLQRPAFAWRAATGPLGCVSVIDALEDGKTRLEVRLFDWVPLVKASEGAAAAKGEVMRYLAELAWAPDAITRNRALSWTVGDDGTLHVAAGEGEARGSVALTLDAEGRVAGISAQDRPRQEGRGFVERPWRGRFFEYRRHGERWLPFRAEVAWILDGTPFVTWRGQLTSWTVA